MSVENKDQCQFCKMLNNHHRTLDCEGMTLEGALQMARLYKYSYNSARKRAVVDKERMKKLIERWHGKFLVVKHENNKLREKLYNK